METTKWYRNSKLHTIQRLICIYCAETRRWLATLVARLALHWLTLKLNKEKEMIRVHNAHSALSFQTTRNDRLIHSIYWPKKFNQSDDLDKCTLIVMIMVMMIIIIIINSQLNDTFQ